MRRESRPLLFVLALLILAACRGEQAPRPGAPASAARPVLLIGWDGADWEVAEPLLASGRMPHLDALRRRGAVADLRSPAPRLSPLLWTTVATGRPPELHGVLDFLEPDPSGGPPRPISRASRRCVALWEIASASRRSCGVVGWWATHPAQDLEGGFMVSDALAATAAASAAHLHGATDLNTIVVPAALREAAGRARLTPDEVPEAEMARLLAPGPSDPELERLLRAIVAATLSYQRVTLAALRGGQPELLLVYFQGIDEVSHLLAHCTAPALTTCPAARAARGGETIAAFYELQDRLLGELLAALTPDTTVLLLSDHGFLSGARRPERRTPDLSNEPGRWHRDTGIFVAAGPEVAAGKMAAVEIGEIAPTVLWLLDLPVAENFEGRPREDLLQAARAASRPITRIPDWDAVVSIPPVANHPDAGAAEQARIDSLRALGYVSSASSGVGDGGKRTVAAEVNLAWRWIQTRRLDEAKATAASAARRAPEYAPGWIALAEAHAACRERAEAAAAFGRALHLLGPGADPDLFLRWAAVAGSDPDPEVVAMLAVAEREGAAEASTARGLLLLAAGATGRAETALRAALARDPAQVEALAALFESCRRRGAEGELEPVLRRALAADPRAVLPRNWLALVREERGDAPEAERLLREAIALAPRHAGSRVNLGALLGRAGRSEEAERVLQEALDLAPEAVEARVGLAVLLSRGSRLADARRVLEDAKPSARQDPRLLNTLALVYRDLGLRQESAATLRASLAADRDQPETTALLRALEEGR